MPEMLCPPDHDLLPLATGEIAAGVVQAHLDTCVPCRQRLEKLRDEVTDLRRAFGGSGAVLGETRDLPAPQLDGSTPVPEEATVEPIARPTTIGKYLVVEELGAGGQARVYRAVHPTLGKQVVVKLSHRTLEQTTQDRLMTEGKLLADLEHPNLARIYDLDCHEGRAFLVMEHIAGRSLEQTVRERKFSPHEAAALVAQLAGAVAAAHRRGILHQDIKPGNILVDEAGQPRLIDFGMARLRHAWSEEESDDPSVGGTPAYMAPEQARGEVEQLDGRSDVYGLGGVLYFLLVGQAPRAGRTLRELVDSACRGDVNRPALLRAPVPATLKGICLRTLAPDPAYRPATPDALAAELERFLARPRRRRRILLAAAALVLIVVAGVAWFAQPSPFPTEPSLSLRVQRQDMAFAQLGPALPLHNGDKLRLTCEIPRGYRASAFWIDTQGQLSELTPIQVVRAGDFDRLTYPPEGVVPVEGPPGTEVVVVCANRWRRPSRDEIAALLAGTPPWPTLPRGVWLSFDNRRMIVDKTSDRGVGRPEADDLSTPIDIHLGGLYPLLRGQCDFLAGLVIPHREDNVVPNRDPPGKTP